MSVTFNALKALSYNYQFGMILAMAFGENHKEAVCLILSLLSISQKGEKLCINDFAIMCSNCGKLLQAIEMFWLFIFYINYRFFSMQVITTEQNCAMEP